MGIGDLLSLLPVLGSTEDVFLGRGRSGEGGTGAASDEAACKRRREDEDQQRCEAFQQRLPWTRTSQLLVLGAPISPEADQDRDRDQRRRQPDRQHPHHANLQAGKDVVEIEQAEDDPRLGRLVEGEVPRSGLGLASPLVR